MTIPHTSMWPTSVPSKEKLEAISVYLHDTEHSNKYHLSHRLICHKWVYWELIGLGSAQHHNTSCQPYRKITVCPAISAHPIKKSTPKGLTLYSIFQLAL